MNKVQGAVAAYTMLANVVEASSQLFQAVSNSGPAQQLVNALPAPVKSTVEQTREVFGAVHQVSQEIFKNYLTTPLYNLLWNHLSWKGKMIMITATTAGSTLAVAGIIHRKFASHSNSNDKNGPNVTVTVNVNIDGKKVTTDSTTSANESFSTEPTKELLALLRPLNMRSAAFDGLILDSRRSG